jgi:hypothetical protein
VSSARNISWIRAAHDVDAIVGKGVRCWVATKCSPLTGASANVSLPATPLARQMSASRYGPNHSFGSLGCLSFEGPVELWGQKGSFFPSSNFYLNRSFFCLLLMVGARHVGLHVMAG